MNVTREAVVYLSVIAAAQQILCVLSHCPWPWLGWVGVTRGELLQTLHTLTHDLIRKWITLWLRHSLTARCSLCGVIIGWWDVVLEFDWHSWFTVHITPHFIGDKESGSRIHFLSFESFVHVWKMCSCLGYYYILPKKSQTQEQPLHHIYLSISCHHILYNFQASELHIHLGINYTGM